MRPRSGAEGGGGGAERAEGGGKASSREKPGGGEGEGEGVVEKRSPSPSSGCCCCCCSSCEPVAAGAKALPSKPGRGPRVLFLLPEREFRRRKLIFFFERERERAEEEVESRGRGRERENEEYVSFFRKKTLFFLFFIHSFTVFIDIFLQITRDVEFSSENGDWN